jgi:hypothetical protein
MPQDISKELRDLLGPKFCDFFPGGVNNHRSENGGICAHAAKQTSVV